MAFVPSSEQSRSTHGLDALTHTPQWLAERTGVRLVTAPTYWRCEPSWSWHPPPLEDHVLWCVLGGVGHLALAGRTQALSAGVCCVFAPGDEPVAAHDPQRPLLVFGMRFTGAGGAPAGGFAPPGQWCQVRDTSLLRGLARRCETTHRRGDDFGAHHARLCVEQILALLWDEAVHPEAGPVDALLDEIGQEIRSDPGRRWSVGELAARTGLSRAQFTRRFTARVGSPPARYLIQQRVSRARQLLGETDMTVTQVAAALGYTDLAHFSRQYKQYTATSPGRVRSQRQGHD
ncbi:helix-turn-helix domain-containing protein [Streptomyces sp. NPDC058576]|uniref:AraC family transcriptional regulator n=1 Tax=Streptomyces sp. NPDC058576 TaxID=3346547 RepID=UPI003646ED03